MITITVSSTRTLEGKSLAATIIARQLSLALKSINVTDPQVLLSDDFEAPIQNFTDIEILELLDKKHFLVTTENQPGVANNQPGVANIKVWENLLRGGVHKETVKEQIVRHCDGLNLLLSESKLSDHDTAVVQQSINSCLFFHKSLG